MESPYIIGPKWDKYLKLTQLVGIIILIFSVGIIWGRTQDRMFDSAEQKNSTIIHTDPESLMFKDFHMSLRDKQSEFVTRREYELLVKGQDEIKEMIRDLQPSKK